MWQGFKIQQHLPEFAFVSLKIRDPVGVRVLRSHGGELQCGKYHGQVGNIILHIVNFTITKKNFIISLPALGSLFCEF